MKTKWLVLFAVATVFSSLASGAEKYWSNVTGSGLWSDLGNWSDGALPAADDTVHVSNNVANASLNIDVPNGVTLYSLRFEGLKSLTVFGGKLTLTCNAFTLKVPDPKPVVDGKASNNLRDYELSTAAILGYYAGAVISNDVEFTGSSSVGIIASEGRFTFHGKVTAPNAANFKIHNGLEEEEKFNWNLAHPNASSTVDFENDVIAPKAVFTPVQAPTGPINFKGKVQFKQLHTTGYIASQIGLYTQEILLTDGLMDLSYTSSIKAWMENAFPANAILGVVLNPKHNTSTNSTSYYLQTYPQTIDRLAGDVVPYVSASGAVTDYDKQGNIYGSSTLTLKGTDSSETSLRLQGEVSLVWDPQGDYTQTFTNRAHETTGSILVKGGTLAMKGTCTFANLSVLEVASGATFVDDSQIAGSLANVGRVVLAGNATFKFGAQAANPFSGGITRLELDQGAKIEVPEGMSITVQSAMMRGVPCVAGTYADGWVTGGGSVVVPAIAGTYWKNESGGAWNDAANWTAGLPAVGNPGFVTCYGDYTIEMASPAEVPGTVEVNNSSGTSTLKIVGDVALDARTTLKFGKGAKLQVPAGGAFVYDGSAVVNNAKSQVASFTDGANLEVTGGLCSFTNMKGVVTFGQKDRVTPNLIKVSAGSFAFFRNSSVANSGVLMAYKGSKIEATGGEVVFGSQSSSEWPLSVDSEDYHLDQSYSGTAALKKVNASGGSMFVSSVGPGEVTFADSAQSVYEKGPGAGSFREYWYSRENEPLEVCFSDSSFTTPESGLGDDGLYVYGCSQPVDLIWDSSSRVKLGSGLYLYDNAHFKVERGYVKTGGYGIRVGVSNGDSASVEVTGGCLELYCQGTRVQGFDGLVLGYGLNASSGSRYGEAVLSGGVISNTAAAAISVGLGYGGTGLFRQTGGELFSKKVTSLLPIVVGFCGGTGTWEMSGGEATIHNDFWIGGCPTNRFGRIYVSYGGTPVITCPDYDGFGATGVLKISGGQMAVKNTMIVGAGENGRLEVNGGTLEVDDLVLSNATTSVVSFKPQGDCAGKLEVKGTLVVRPGSKLEIDVTGYTGRNVDLLKFGDKDGFFDAADIALVKPEGSRWEYMLTENGIRLVNVKGLYLNFR